MSRVNKLILIITVALSVCVVAIRGFTQPEGVIDQVAGLRALPDGQTLLAVYGANSVELSLLDQDGGLLRNLSLRRETDGELTSIADMGMDAEHNIYLLKDLLDAKTGKLLRQELEVYDLTRTFGKRVTRRSIANDAMRYRWLDVSTTLVLMGTDSDEETLVRRAFDLSPLLMGAQLTPKSERSYPLDRREGIYKVAVAGGDVAYISRSGKLFFTGESLSAPREVYPARELTELMYPVYIAPVDAGHVLIGEQESGNLLSVDLETGTTEQLKSGTEPFSGVSSFVPDDLVGMSMIDAQNFSGLVRSKTAEGYNLLVCRSGATNVIYGIRTGAAGLLLHWALSFLGWAAAILFICQLIRGLFYLLRSGRTILVKLMIATLPLLAATLALFGVFSYLSYRSWMEESFEKQVVDEGNLLTALFGPESFDEIEYPYDYTTEAYTYLHQQMSTRALHTATAYYERGKLYVGVDSDYPCFYPLDMRLDSRAAELYQQAAYTGQAKTGTLRDARGERIVCVTPIGGVSGGTVYLLETGIPAANLRQYTDSYLRRYVLVSISFLLVIGVVLAGVFVRILSPIGEIREGLEQFSRGNRSVRLTNTASDEFSDIVRVFNKMANDIDEQIYSLRQASEIYFRFIPQKMLQLLGKENLGDIELGSCMQRDCHLLFASLSLRSAELAPQQEQDLTNRFFNIVNQAAERFGGMLISNSVNLRRLCVICPEGGDTAVNAALSALSMVDGVNATLPVQSRLQALFVVHRTRVRYAICGDEQRLVPALLSGDLDAIASQEPALRQLSSRLIVTAAAFADVDNQSFFHRFIGYLDKTEQKFGLYDFYDASTPEETRLLNDTRSTFAKAMELYLQKRYYDAKNLFALVLRQNQYDNVARHYIFDCEKKL